MEISGAFRLFFFSTDMTYGIPTVCPVRPDHPQPPPSGPYGRSKKQAERIIRAGTGVRASIFRPCLITRPGRLGVLGKLFRLIQKNLPVPMIGSGTNRYQIVGVEDCARAALLGVKAGCPPGPLNLGSATPPTTRQFLLEIIRHASSRSVLLPYSHSLLRPLASALDAVGVSLLYPEQFQLDTLFDTSKANHVLGWKPA
jgi:nucleoside-diphosphate-sugar epimerase